MNKWPIIMLCLWGISTCGLIASPIEIVKDESFSIQPGILVGGTGIALDNQGNIYIADRYGNKCVKIFKDGSVLQKEVPDPTGICLDHSHNWIYVVSSNGNSVYKYNMDLVPLPDFSVLGLTHPCGVAVDSEGNVFVADTWGDRILKCGSSGNILKEQTGNVSGDAFFNDPVNVDVDPQGNVYVNDIERSWVLKFDNDLKFLSKWSGSIGGLPFHWPWGLGTDFRGNVFVADQDAQGYIHVVDGSGQYLGSIRDYVTDLDVAFDGYMYGVLGSNVFKYQLIPNIPLTIRFPNGSEILQAGSNVGIQWDSSRTLSGIKFEYSTDNGITWVSIATNAPDTGVYNWTVPIVKSDTCLVRITDATNPEVTDTSDATFKMFACNLYFPYETQWGKPNPESPSIDVDMNRPSGMATDLHGNIIVADETNNRIQKFDANGNLIAWLGGCNRQSEHADNPNFGHWHEPGTGHSPVAGSQPLQFNNPSGVAVDLEGNLYVVENLAAKVQIIPSNGSPVRYWDELGSNSNPNQIVLDNNSGYAYVSDSGRLVVHKFDTLDLTARGPVATWSSWDGAIAGDTFGNPVGLAVDSQGLVYVSDFFGCRIVVFNSGKQYQREWGTQGFGDNQFTYQTDIAFDSEDRLFVVDRIGCVKVFTKQGQFMYKWGTDGSLPGQFHYASGITLGLDGDVFVADTHNYRVQKFASPKSFLTVKFPNGGESFVGGAAEKIMWEKLISISIPFVKLELLTEEAPPILIADNVPNTGEFNWTVPLISSSTCKIRISGFYEDACVVSDTSDNCFTIATVREALVDLDPDTLNLKSNGQYVTAYITLPEGFSASNINTSSIVISKISGDLINPPYGLGIDTSFTPVIGDRDNDEIPDLTVKFIRSDLVTILYVGDRSITVSFELTDGTKFEGSDIIRVINRGK